MFEQVSGVGTGGGHGAPGGSQFESVTGGAMYDDTRVPTSAGSGGGDSSSGVGGAGGGFLNISTFYEVNVEGMYILKYCSISFQANIIQGCQQSNVCYILGFFMCMQFPLYSLSFAVK